VTFTEPTTQQYLPTAPCRGTRDFLPAEMSVRQQVFGALHRCIERFGYQRYDGPLLESAEIYEAKSGDEIASEELYSLTDRAGRRLAIRPEMTPSAARIIAGNAGRLQFPVRWYCNVNCHRYQRPQRGPLSACEVVVLPVDAALHGAARRVAAGLRAAGYRVTLPVEPRKLGTEVRRAAEAGAVVAVILGPDEWERGELTVRDLRGREQETVSVAGAGDAVGRLLCRTGQATD
jgi:histidyl-tRNA synthetase